MTPDDPEAALHELLSRYARREPWELRHPIVALRAAALMRALPPKTYRPSGTRASQIISHQLKRSHFGLSSPLHEAVTLLELPEQPGTYDVGPHLASQRQHARRALREGVTWSLVRDAAEKEHFLELADANERARSGAGYRPEEINLRGLLGSDLWLAARVDERPLLLTVAAVDGEWSMLRYFVSLESSRVASSTRYLMTGVLAEELAARGARYACDFVSPFRLPSGLRQFSRMVGFRTHRVRVR